MQRFFSFLSPLVFAALIVLPACSSSRPAQEDETTTTAAAPAPAPAPEGGPTRMVFFGGPGGPGGPQMTPEQRSARRLALLDSVLTLSTEQESRIRPILLADILDTPPMRPEDFQNMTQEQMMARANQMRERRERVNRAIEGVLTPEQVTQYRAYLQQERERMMQQGGQRIRFNG